MLSFKQILENQTAEIKKLEEEFSSYNFKQSATSFTFMAMIRPLRVQAGVYAHTRDGSNYKNDPEVMVGLIAFKSKLNFPKREEINANLEAVNNFIVRAQALETKFKQKVNVNFDFVESIVNEGNKMVSNNPIVVSTNANPPIVPMQKATQAEKQEPKKGRDDEGVSFMRSGFLNKKK